MMKVSDEQRKIFDRKVPRFLEMHDEAERASRTTMSIIAPETNETTEVRISVFVILSTDHLDWLWRE